MATKELKDINPEQLAVSIKMLETHLPSEEIITLLEYLKMVQRDPSNDEYLSQMKDEFYSLGIIQGAVLTYAPYLIVIFSDDPYEREKSDLWNNSMR